MRWIVMSLLKFRTGFESRYRHVSNRERSTTALPEQGTLVSIVPVTGTLRAPVTSELGQAIEANIRVGQQRVLLDLSGLVDIDAAGVGELVRVFKAMSAAAGVLQIAHAEGYVRRLLEVSGVFTLLNGGPEA